MPDLLLGQTLGFSARPTAEDPEACVDHETHGAVLIEAGLIREVGPADVLRTRYPDVRCTDFGAHLILPGFVDAHAHYSQTAIIASWGKRLIDWLQCYTFPEEMRLADPDYAAAIAARYLDLNLSHGITTSAAYCTSHPTSVEALFAEAEARGLRQIAGKVMMDRNAPPDLCDTPERGYDESAALIARWHGRGRLGYAITPRFAPTSSPAQLEAAGALWARHPDLLLQTHLSEQPEEIAWVASLFPDCADYLAVYERFGLCGPGAVMGHAIHLSPREWDGLRDRGAGIAHCPTSNTFIGSGLFDMAGAFRHGIPTGLATDVGGGSSFSMLRTMAAAYEISQLAGAPLHPLTLLWLATAGSAQVLRLDQQIGTLAPGQEADLVVLDLASTPAIAQRAAQADTLSEAIFPTIMMGDDRAIAAVYVAGQRWMAHNAAPA